MSYCIQRLHAAGRFRRSYSKTPTPETPMWQLVFVNARLFFVGSTPDPSACLEIREGMR